MGDACLNGSAKDLLAIPIKALITYYCGRSQLLFISKLFYLVAMVSIFLFLVHLDSCDRVARVMN